MLVTLLLIAVVAPLGAFDILYYHLYRFRLYDQPTARWETVTHLARNLMMGLGAMGLFHFEPHGSWFWFFGGMFLLDFANEIADVLLEPAARAPLGGLPPIEYLLHIVGSTFAGGITVAFFILGWAYQFEPTALVPLTQPLPTWLLWQGRVVAVGAFVLFAGEGTLLLRSVLRRPKSQPA